MPRGENVLVDFNRPKKVPRIVLAQTVSSLRPIPGLQAYGPERSESPVYDLSLSGIVLGPQTASAKARAYHGVEVLLRIDGIEDSIRLQARLAQTSDSHVAYLFENSTEGRLILEQSLKDRIIISSSQEMPLSVLPSSLKADRWLHAAFDTNLLLWKKPGSEEILRLLVEYENLVWIYEDGETLLQKTSGALEESQPYLDPQKLFTPGARISQGASWMDRLIKCVDKIDAKEGGLFQATQLLRRCRDQ